SVIDNGRVNGAKYVITRPFPGSGLGANLLSMVGALYVCEQTGRALIVDWTGMDALRDKQTNYFVAFFEPIRKWRAIDIFYVNDPDDPSRCAPKSDADAFRPTDEQLRDLLDGRIAEPAVLLQPFLYDRVFRRTPLTRAAVFHYTRAFYEQLTPPPVLRTR